jgi:outer membrane protein TolC
LSLTLADAIRLAERTSEVLRIARAATDRAGGQQLQARSQLLPQVNGSASYQRAIQLQFEEITKRLGSGDTASTGGGGDSGGGFADSPLARVFASPNTVVLGVNASQTLYAGGQVRAAIAAAEAGVLSAAIGTKSARASLVLSVAEAYFNAQVAEQLAVIAESSFVQADRALRQTQVAREVGNVAEFDLIRARVQRDNARPAVIGARSQRDIALLRLRQLLNVPLNQPLQLSTALETGAAPGADALVVSRELLDVDVDTSVVNRAPVRQAEALVRVQERQVEIARAQRLPAVSLSTAYQRFAYPAEGTFLESNWQYYFPNWTVSLGVSVPFFTGGRIKGEVMVAQAGLLEARERYEQTRKAAALDQELAIAALVQAEAELAASAGTDEQAARAYAIAEVRFAEGLATQLELSQTRVDLETARAYRVQSARDVALARLKLALLRDLPLATGGSTGGQ